MAEYALINGYLDALRGSVRWRRDVDDLIDEIEDHLLSAVERIEKRGLDRARAQQATLERFGDPDLIAVALASTPQGGLAVPTEFTKSAGLAGIYAAGLMILVPTMWNFGIWVDDRNGPFESNSTSLWIVMTVALMSSLALTLILMVGLLRRHGGLGAPGVVGIALMGLAIVTSFAAWAVPVWGGLIAAGALTYAAAMWNRGMAPRGASLALGGGMIIGIGTGAVLTVLEVGWRDSYGDYPAAWMTGLWIGMAITAAGAYGLGRFLRNEEPVDLTPTDHAMTA